MSRTTVTQTIDAPVEQVFETIAHIDNFSKAIPHIVNVQILSDAKAGVGTRFRETRLMNGKEVTTELEVTEYVENELIRLVSDTNGTIWDTLFTVKPLNDQTRLTLTMDAKAYNILSRIMNPLIKGVVRRALEKDMKFVKDYCEQEKDS